MNFKPGMLVLCVGHAPGVTWCAPYVGTVRVVREASRVHDRHWLLEPPTRDEYGYEGSWHERRLVPIRDNPGEDETLTWAGRPEKVSA